MPTLLISTLYGVAEPHDVFRRAAAREALRTYGRLTASLGRSVLTSSAPASRVCSNRRRQSMEERLNWVLDLESCLSLLPWDDQRLLVQSEVEGYRLNRCDLARHISMSAVIRRHHCALERLASIMAGRSLL